LRFRLPWLPIVQVWQTLKANSRYDVAPGEERLIGVCTHTNPFRLVGRATIVLLVALMSAGCTAVPRLAMQAERYQLEIRMNPASHELTGRATLDMVSTQGAAVVTHQPVGVELLLHPDLRITSVVASGAEVIRASRVNDGAPAAAEFQPTTYQIILARPVRRMTLFVEYQGRLWQNVAAGEVAGEIHNETVRAHIGEEGIFLGESHWYPRPAVDNDTAAGPADYTVLVDPIQGMEVLASAEEDMELSQRLGRLAWRSPYPLPGMVLVGGPHVVHRITRDNVTISLHLKADQAQHADGLFDAVSRQFDRYEPLIGPYPARQFSVVDNFFSSGFAFPTFTLLSSAVIDMGRWSQTTHGYLDHEMLHCWWGNGIFVNPGDGNWCEALASYGANYYGYVLDGDEVEARRKRRNYCHFLSRIPAATDRPLGTYDRPGGCSRSIAYDKGAMVFHMLARKMGQENFWAAMRRFTAEYVGKTASWDDIRRLCEAQSGLDLGTFFGQWVRRPGCPDMTIQRARYDSTAGVLELSVGQTGPAFEVNLPIRITHTGGTTDVDVAIEVAEQTVGIPLDAAPVTVELDPDYHVFRRMPPDAIIPTTAATMRGKSLATVLPAGHVPEAYDAMRSIFESGVAQGSRHILVTGEIGPGRLAESCVVILGEAVRDEYVAAFLEAIEFPVHWRSDGFEFEGVGYNDPGHALLCTSLHPGVEGGGVTVVFANSEAALPKPANIPMYDRSLVIFNDRTPIVRKDFESRKIVRVE